MHFVANRTQQYFWQLSTSACQAKKWRHSLSNQQRQLALFATKIAKFRKPALLALFCHVSDRQAQLCKRSSREVDLAMAVDNVIICERQYVFITNQNMYLHTRVVSAQYASSGIQAGLSVRFQHRAIKAFKPMLAITSYNALF